MEGAPSNTAFKGEEPCAPSDKIVAKMLEFRCGCGKVGAVVAAVDGFRAWAGAIGAHHPLLCAQTRPSSPPLAVPRLTTLPPLSPQCVVVANGHIFRAECYCNSCAGAVAHCRTKGSAENNIAFAPTAVKAGLDKGVDLIFCVQKSLKGESGSVLRGVQRLPRI